MNIDRLLSYQIPAKTEFYDWRKAALYALGVNVGADPLDEADLKFLFEQDIRVLPMFGMTLAHPGFWVSDPALEVDWKRALHAEQYLTIENSMPADGKVTACYKVTGVRDKGEGRGSIMYFEKTLRDANHDRVYCRVITGLFCRGDGGVGDHGDAPDALEPVPDQAAHHTDVVKLDQRAALIYRLSGDFNPIHISPTIAAQAGFERPILHGLCTMGVAGRSIIRSAADNDPGRLAYLACRFSKPVIPGETLIIESWRNADGDVQFRAVAEERDEVVLDRGVAKIR